MRGFKRTNPANDSAHKPPVSTPTKKTPPTKPKVPVSVRPRTSSNPTPGSASGPHATEPEPSASGTDGCTDNDNRTSISRGKYCHHFVNQGICRYEERTGEKCKFEHKMAPMPKDLSRRDEFNHKIEFLL